MNCIVWIIYNIKLCDFNITLKVQLYSFLLLFNTSAMDKRLKGGGSVTIFLIYLVLYNTFLIKCSVCILGLLICKSCYRFSKKGNLCFLVEC